MSNVPVITIHVRHSADCPNKDDSFYKRCRCPKTLRYFANGKQQRQSAKTRTWSIAEDKKRELEDRFRAAGTTLSSADVKLDTGSARTIGQMVELFVSDKETQGLEGGVLAKYERELGRFSEFMARRSKFFPSEIGMPDLTVYRSSWAKLYPSSTTRSKVQERLRAFLRYCVESGVLERAPKLSAIRVDEVPTLPLTDDEYRRLLEAAQTEFPGEKGVRVHALIRLMRHSGLAIGDAVRLQRTDLKKDPKREIYRIVTSRQKTGTHVSVAIPPDVASEVLAAMRLNDHADYIFWKTGTGKPQTAVTNWQHDLRQVFRASGMATGHPHQLRDTFAVSLLRSGLPLEEVSKLLGHTSIKTTEKSYSPWVQSRQDRLDDLVVGTWS